MTATHNLQIFFAPNCAFDFGKRMSITGDSLEIYFRSRAAFRDNPQMP